MNTETNAIGPYQRFSVQSYFKLLDAAGADSRGVTAAGQTDLAVVEVDGELDCVAVQVYCPQSFECYSLPVKYESIARTLPTQGHISSFLWAGLEIPFQTLDRQFETHVSRRGARELAERFLRQTQEFHDILGEIWDPALASKLGDVRNIAEQTSRDWQYAGLVFHNRISSKPTQLLESGDGILEIIVPNQAPAEVHA